MLLHLYNLQPDESNVHSHPASIPSSEDDEGVGRASISTQVEPLDEYSMEIMHNLYIYINYALHSFNLDLTRYKTFVIDVNHNKIGVQGMSKTSVN